MGQILIGNAVAEFPSLHHAFFVGDILIKRDCRLLQSLARNCAIVNMYVLSKLSSSISFAFSAASTRRASSIQTTVSIVVLAFWILLPNHVLLRVTICLSTVILMGSLGLVLPKPNGQYRISKCKPFPCQVL